MRARTVLVFVLSLAARTEPRLSGPPHPGAVRMAPPVREARVDGTGAGERTAAPPTAPPVS